jgi:hypothetical protein
MSIVALAIGILFGLWCFGGQRTGWLFTIFHSSIFSTKKGFYNLYDVSDDEVSYEWYSGHNDGIKKYADYLKLHADARESAYDTFKGMYDAIVKSFLIRILPISITPAILFWSNWYLYIIGVFASVGLLVVYEIAKYGVRPGFYQRLVIYTTLSTYAKKKTKSGQ